MQFRTSSVVTWSPGTTLLEPLFTLEGKRVLIAHYSLFDTLFNAIRFVCSLGSIDIYFLLNPINCTRIWNDRFILMHFTQFHLRNSACGTTSTSSVTTPVESQPSTQSTKEGKDWLEMRDALKERIRILAGHMSRFRFNMGPFGPF